MTKQADFDRSQLKAFSGHYLDEGLLKESSSGGAANMLAEMILHGGGCVFGVAYTPDFRGVEYRCVESVDELPDIKGSKYSESANQVLYQGKRQPVYPLLQKKLEEGKTVLFIGLGCKVAAARSYLLAHETDISNFYTADLICMGPLPAKVLASYIDGLEKKYRSKIYKFTERYKKIGWVPKYVHAEFENGKTYEIPFYDSDYGEAFSFCARTPCYQCKFKTC